MLIFYTPTSTSQSSTCDASCDASCGAIALKSGLRVKSKCCEKYKKKGINCKRCPRVLLEMAS